MGTRLDAHNLVIRKGKKDILILADTTVLPQWVREKELVEPESFSVSPKKMVSINMLTESL